MYLSDTSSITQYLKNIPLHYNFENILTDNTTIFEQENNKQKLQIPEVLHIKNKHPKFNRINFKSSANVFKCI